MTPEDTPEVEAPLRSEEIVARGGIFGGLLLDNPFIGLGPALTWSFDFDCDDVVRGESSSSVSVSVSFVPMAAVGWTSLAPDRAGGQIFAEPAEPSLYYYEHHRFDAFDLVLHEQRATELLATLTMHGDVDGLGLDVVSVTAWLRFTGIAVQLSDVSTPIDALQRLASLTDTQGLVLKGPSHIAYNFQPDSG